LKFWVLVRGRHHFSWNGFSPPPFNGFELGDRLVTGQNHHLPTPVSSAQGLEFCNLGFLGIVNPGNDAVYLSLKKGSNELMLAISELGGGWGFICRLVDMEN